MEGNEESSINTDKIIQKDIEIENNSVNKNDEDSIQTNNEDIKYEAKILNIPESSQPKDSLTFKIIIVGNSGVGKTSITNNAVKNVFFESYKATIGMEIFSLFVKVNHKIIKLQIWDTCGQEIYRSLITNFYRNSSLAIIVYSIDKKNSFKDIELWLKELRLYSSPDIKVILIGNKSDLKDKREVNYEEGHELAEKFGIKFYETSAKTGENIQEIFADSVNDIATKLDEGYYDLEKQDCGIKQGIIDRNISIERINSEISSKHKKKCCK